MNKERTYLIILGVLITLFILVQVLQPKPTDWSESFSSTDKIPYGGYIIHQILGSAFPQNEIIANTTPIFEYDTATSGIHNWIFINDRFGLDEWETEILLSQVERGSELFIAARNFTQKFADTLKLDTQFGNPVLKGSALFEDDTTSVNFTNPSLKKDGGWHYQQSTTEAHFIRVDSSRTTILGVNSADDPNFIKVHWGEGNIYLHSNPTLFTNFFVKEKPGADYALTALSYLPEQSTIWDEYYKSGRAAGNSALRYVVSKEHLRWAWFLALAGVVLFMIFRARRSQRIIPVMEAPKNSSVEFARTIGNLYLEKGNHKLIAEKKISYFLDYIRSQIGLGTSVLDDEFKNHLSQRSGIPPEDIYSTFDLIEMVPEKDIINKNELKLITERIDRFYNKSQR